ncbi:MAG: hypothetical protein HC817_16220 [Saprospiraceae bacterium]|nr:hypothetical protein [Saprospiraceae bacterium]
MIIKVLFFSSLLFGTPSVFATNFTFTGAGDWTDATRWSPSVPPSILRGNHLIVISGNCTYNTLDQQVFSDGTEVVIESSGQFNLLTGLFDFQTDGLFINSGIVNISGGTLRVVDDIINVKTINLSSNGRLSIFGDNATMPGGIFNWTGGEVAYTGNGILTIDQNLTIAPNCKLISFGGIVKLDAAVTNNGSLNTTGSGNIQVNNVLTNNAAIATSGTGALDIRGTLQQAGTLDNSGSITLAGDFIAQKAVL